MIRKLFTAAVSAFAAGALCSCFTLPFKPRPVVVPAPETPTQRVKPKAEPVKPAPPAVEVNAFYETGAASTSFFVSRPESSQTDRLPDKILRRGTVVQVLVPKAGADWAKVKLVDAQTGYVPLEDLDIVAPDLRPSGFPGNRSGIDTDSSLELPEPPTVTPSSESGSDTIRFDGPELEEPLSPSVPGVPDPLPSGGADAIPTDDLPGN